MKSERLALPIIRCLISLPPYLICLLFFVNKKWKESTGKALQTIKLAHVCNPWLFLYRRWTNVWTRDTTCIVLTFCIAYTDGVGKTFKSLLYALKSEKPTTLLICFPVFCKPLNTSVIVLSSLCSAPIVIFFTCRAIESYTNVALGISYPD